ncbi:abortive infection bacteriophage resistance protein [Erwinia toletana]|uniref:Abortive infection bacteriophage resistance protein n=1 Tax=Winslowiella toletana TaxID=92490 RepID=A0ABS4P368_9GAMM|nr:Abi family protein [Winslowiella toletana]MBP2167105.1 abortive infection bacteriophage resistance protein [Winslowiella toletana]
MGRQQNSRLRLYQKPPETIPALTARLRRRGLIINDENAAVTVLTFIGYFRLRGYCIPFYQVMQESYPRLVEPKTFISGTRLEDIIALYEFDRKLRLIVLEQIQKVEIGLRTCLSEYMCAKYGSHWFMDLTNLDNDYDYEGFFGQIREAKEVFIDHYKEKYGHPKYPPSWMITETLSFGAWSRIYKNLHHYDQKKIAEKFNIRNTEVMTSWFHTLSHFRNLAAHHNRILNRVFKAFPPSRLNGYEHHMSNPQTLYSRLVVLKYLSDQVSWSDGLKNQLNGVMAEKPDCVTWEKMGFIPGWASDPLWTRAMNPPPQV